MTGRIDLKRGLIRQIVRRHLKVKLQTAGFTDPVPLHQPYFIWPMLQPVDGRQQFVRHVRNTHEPLDQFPPLNRRAGSPAFAINHLLIRQNRIVDRVPVHD